ncbi:MAG: hypothetical protein ACRD4R_08680 [Candidatus Acidiferrales bacterium]
MPKTPVFDPYESLLRQAESNPALRERIRAAQQAGIPASITMRRVAAKTGDLADVRPFFPPPDPRDDPNSPHYSRFPSSDSAASDPRDATPIYPSPSTPAVGAESGDGQVESATRAPGDAGDGKPFEWGMVPGRRDKRGIRGYRRVAPWYEEVARIMADGTPLKIALARASVRLTPREIHNLYRNLAFRELYRRERREFLRTWGRAKIRRGALAANFHKH